MTIAATVWEPNGNQEGDYDPLTAVNLTDPVTSSTIITDPVSGANIISTDTTFTAIASTVWTFDESA